MSYDREHDDPWSTSPQQLEAPKQPHDLLAEQSVLGAAMLSKSALGEVLDLLTPEDFYDPRHEVIFQAIHALAAEGQPVDEITVMQRLHEDGNIGKIPGGPTAIHELSGNVPTAANAGFYAEIVREKAAHRRMIEFGLKITQDGFSALGDPAEKVEELRVALEGVIGEKRITLSAIGDRWENVVTSLETPPPYIETPWREINSLMGGLRDGGLYVVAARPGAGKTIVGLQLAAALADRGPVAFSALEMSEDQLLQRLIAQKGQVSMSSISRHDLSVSEKAQLGLAKSRVERLPLYVDDRSGVNVMQIKTFARQVARQGAIAGVVVDYLQLVSSHDKRMAVHDMVGEIARQLKILARELDCPVIVLSQLNRESVQVKGAKGAQAQRPPTLADLSKSDAIGHHADVVLMLQRRLEQDGDPGDVIDIFLTKNRHGNVGRRPLRWEGKFSRIVSNNEGHF